LADEFRAALEHVVGAQSKLATICIGPDDNMEKRRQDIVDAISTVDGGKGVVLLTDMFGGTPSNLAISLLEKDHVEVIAGINLPMLIKFSSIRETMDLQEAVLEAKEAAQKYISVASEVLGNS
jgi:PTS system mannose-specific IIA component